MELNGKAIQANKNYTVAAWAGMDKDQQGPKIWDVVANYLRDQKVVAINELNLPTVKNVQDNKGFAKT
jgi:sulfur-oxidizing protein SoxB